MKVKLPINIQLKIIDTFLLKCGDFNEYIDWLESNDIIRTTDSVGVGFYAKSEEKLTEIILKFD